MSRPLRVLIAGAASAYADVVAATARECGFEVDVEQAESIHSLCSTWDVMVGSVEALPLTEQGNADAPCVVLLPSSDEAATACAIRAGARAVPCGSELLLRVSLERALRDAARHRRYVELEEALAKSEERYQDLVETANDVVLAIDLQGNFTALNAAGEQISGYTREEVRRMNMRDVLTPESLQRALQMIRQKLESGQATTYELELVRRDGRIVPLEVSSKIIYHDGQPVGVHGIARDITERRQAEEELRARERKQASVAQLGQDALAEMDLSGLFDKAVHCVAETLAVQYCTALELIQESMMLEPRAGVGWREGVLENESVAAGPESQAGYTLLACEPVIVDDLATESRFSIPRVLIDHSVTSGISVIIHGHKKPFGVLSAFTCVRRQFKQDDVHFLQAVANVLAAAVERKRLEDERAQHDKELAARVLQAQEEERKRIARELHDETAQTLSILLTNLDLLQRRLPRNDSAVTAGFRRVESLARRALDETRALSHDLRPAILDDAGLVAALEWIGAEYGRTFGGTVQVSSQLSPDAVLSPEAEVALFRIAQEALMNAGKHARARHVYVTLSVSDTVAELIVRDDGRGFDPGQLQGPTRESGLGMYGMAERAALFGGDVAVQSTPGKGTELRARLPLYPEPATMAAKDSVGIT